jgi:hypothetical protein
MSKKTLQDNNDCKYLCRSLRPSAIKVIAFCLREIKPQLILIGLCENCKHFTEPNLKSFSQCLNL